MEHIISYLSWGIRKRATPKYTDISVSSTVYRTVRSQSTNIFTPSEAVQ